ncbi:MAG: ABC transporter ATP-binding protein [Planctomycetes bacterium]|nr:ABC transporter ATP-binding protein [Planctomycetota bacterium]
MSAIAVSGFVKKYGGATAVDGVDFDVRAGEVFALLGPNGAGKSTIVRAMVGLHAPTAGTVTIAGFDIVTNPVEAKRRLGYLPESAQLYEALTAREHLALVARLHRIPETRAADAIERVLELLDLKNVIDAPIASYSKGMKQKTALAGALLSDPDVLILDEPMSGLDAEAALVLRSLVRELAARGRCVLYTSHLLDVVEKVADRVAILVKGKLAALGTLSEIRAQAGSNGDLAEVFATLVRSEDPASRARQILDSIKKES